MLDVELDVIVVLVVDVVDVVVGQCTLLKFPDTPVPRASPVCSAPAFPIAPVLFAERPIGPILLFEPIRPMFNYLLIMVPSS